MIWQGKKTDTTNWKRGLTPMWPSVSKSLLQKRPMTSLWDEFQIRQVRNKTSAVERSIRPVHKVQPIEMSSWYGFEKVQWCLSFKPLSHLGGSTTRLTVSGDSWTTTLHQKNDIGVTHFFFSFFNFSGFLRSHSYITENRQSVEALVKFVHYFTARDVESGQYSLHSNLFFVRVYCLTKDVFKSFYILLQAWVKNNKSSWLGLLYYSSEPCVCLWTCSHCLRLTLSIK